ncbi:MAG TPA: respiratory nitrate reductase subunit gamma [Steroidobacter sp.]|uniref:respiratory nitrate reductase subunit gamma n=1 Tax=Steroidobacter sp. TaxID=1978227 RepID=UPI002ED910AC
MSHLHLFAFQIYPYIALAVCLIGSWIRYDRSMYTWRTGSSQLLSDRGMRVGSNMFHVGVLAILGGHLVGLLTPHSVYESFITPAQKQLLAMSVGGVFGAMCFVGIVILLVRRLTNPRVRATGTRGDTMVLVLLFAQLVLGLYSIAVSRHHMDGGVMVALAEWAQHIVTFRGGAAEFMVGVHWVYKAHVLLGMTLFLIAPFTRLVHIWSIPVSYLWRPYQVVRRRQAAVVMSDERLADR